MSKEYKPLGGRMALHICDKLHLRLDDVALVLVRVYPDGSASFCSWLDSTGDWGGINYDRDEGKVSLDFESQDSEEVSDDKMAGRHILSSVTAMDVGKMLQVAAAYAEAIELGISPTWSEDEAG